MRSLRTRGAFAPAECQLPLFSIGTAGQTVNTMVNTMVLTMVNICDAADTRDAALVLVQSQGALRPLPHQVLTQKRERALNDGTRLVGIVQDVERMMPFRIVDDL